MALPGVSAWHRAAWTAIVVLVALALAHRGLPRAAAEERLNNGGFEEGTVGWTPIGLDFDTSCAGDESPAAGRLTVSGFTGRLVSDPVTIDPSGSYVVAGSVSLGEFPPLDTKAWVELRWYASSDGTTSSLAETDPQLLTWVPPTAFYSPQQTTVSPPEGAVSVRLSVYLSSQQEVSACVDNLSFDGPPPPTLTPVSPQTSTPAPAATTTPLSTTTPTNGTTPTRMPTPAATAIPLASLLNGGCEEVGAEGHPDGWLKFGGTLSRTSDSPRGGAFACALTSTTESTKWAYQIVRVTRGRAYRFEGYLRVPAPGSSVWLRISWYDSTDGSGSAIQQDDSPEVLTGPHAAYRFLGTGAVIAPPTARSARLRVMLAPASAAPATVFLDDFAFTETEVPTPTLRLTAAPEAAETPIRGETERTEAGYVSEASSIRTSRQERRTGGSRTAPTEVAPAARSAGPFDSPFLLKISEVLYHPAKGDQAPREWVELYNAGPQPVDITGWSLADNSSSDLLPTAWVVPGDFLVVAGGQAFGHDFPTFNGTVVYVEDGKIGNGLADGGDRLLLRDPEGRLADALSYGDDREFFDPPLEAVAAGHSLERIDPGRDTDTAADFRDSAQPSPGRGPWWGTATDTPTAQSEVRGAQSQAGSDGGLPWFWLIVAGLVFVGGVGAGAAGVSFWLRRRQIA